MTTLSYRVIRTETVDKDNPVDLNEFEISMDNSEMAYIKHTKCGKSISGWACLLLGDALQWVMAHECAEDA
jgi:hypothetical protein